MNNMIDEAGKSLTLIEQSKKLSTGMQFDLFL